MFGTLWNDVMSCVFLVLLFLTELDQITEEFVKWCGSPSASMTMEEFRQVALKLGMTDASCESYFRCVFEMQHCLPTDPVLGLI